MVGAAAWVAFAAPAATYSDPVALMGDMQISSGFEEGYAYSGPYDASPVDASPEAEGLRRQMATVQQQVKASVQSNPALKNQLATVDVQAASSQVQQAVDADDADPDGPVSRRRTDLPPRAGPPR